jgi:Ca-activated chloride channel family protein
VLTDGRDRDSRFAIGRDQFLTRLAARQDSRRPVPVFAVGYGADADMATLTGMAKVTGGRAIPSADPEDLARAIAQVFVAAHDRATA